MTIPRKLASEPVAVQARYGGGLAQSLVRTLLLFTFIPLLLMGGAAYYRARGLLQDQVLGQMQSQIAAQVGGVDLSIRTKEIRLDRLARSPDLIAAAQRAFQAGGPGSQLDATRADFGQIFRSVNPEGGAPTFNQFLLVSPGGQISLASKPEWEGVSLRNLPLFTSVSSTAHRSFSVFDGRPLYPNELVLLTISQLRTGEGGMVGTLIGVTESQALQTILQNLATPSSGAEALFVTQDGAFIGADPYTNEMAPVEVPASEKEVISAALNRMMNQQVVAQASVQFTNAQGARALGQVLWLESFQTGIVYQIAESRVFGALSSLVPFTIGILLAALLAMGGVLTLGARRVFRPLAALADITRKFSDGDFSQRATVHSKDEIGLLAQSFNHMAEELSSLYRSLEQKVEERTRQIWTAAEVAERITSTTNLKDLLERTVRLLIEQFHFYQASVFMLDRGGRYAVLQAAAGPAATGLLAKGHRLEVGSASIIGWVTANNQPRIASDVAEDEMHLRNEMLPETRSEAGIPIAAAGHVLGVLDVQSSEAGAFGPETVVMLQTLANQMAVAIQNMSLIESGQTDMRELERLHAASRQIASAKSPQEAFATTAALLADAIYPAFVLSAGGGKLTFVGAAATSPAQNEAIGRVITVLQPAIGELARIGAGGAVVVEPTTAGVPAPLVECTRVLGHRSVAFLPIMNERSLAGVIVIGSPTKTLTQAALEPYASMADLVGITLSKVAEMSDRERDISEREAVNAIGLTVARSSDDLSAFFAAVHNQVRRNIGEYPFVVATFDASAQTLAIPYAYQDGRVDKSDPFPVGEGLPSLVVRTGQPLLLAKDVEGRALILGAKIAARAPLSWMGAPMLIEGSAIGALIVQDFEHEHSFGDRELTFLAELANRVATVLHNAHLLDESRSHAIQLETAAEIARDISASLNLDELLSKAVNYLRERLGFHHAAVFLIDARGEYAAIREATGDAGAQMKRSGHKLGVGSRSVVGFVAGRGEPLVVNDTSKDSTYFANPLLPTTRSEAAMPLKVGDRIVGVMDVQSTSPNAFQEDSIRTLQILADQLAVAVVNSELFAETQEHLSQHRLLHHITTSAASGSTLEEALESAVSGMQVTLGGDRVSILLTGTDGKSLEVKAAAGYSEEIMRLRIPMGSGITGWSAAHRRSLRVDDVSQDPRYIEASGNTKSELAVPLMYRNEALGVLNVESERAGAYTENDEEMLATLAGSLAAIIANARLLEQVRSQAERERALFEITSKIRRAPDMQSILATTASELTRVVGARRAEIRVSTEERNGNTEKGE